MNVEKDKDTIYAASDVVLSEDMLPNVLLLQYYFSFVINKKKYKVISLYVPQNDNIGSLHLTHHT